MPTDTLLADVLRTPVSKAAPRKVRPRSNEDSLVDTLRELAGENTAEAIAAGQMAAYMVPPNADYDEEYCDGVLPYREGGFLYVDDKSIREYKWVDWTVKLPFEEARSMIANASNMFVTSGLFVIETKHPDAFSDDVPTSKTDGKKPSGKGGKGGGKEGGPTSTEIAMVPIVLKNIIQDDLGDHYIEMEFKKLRSKEYETVVVDLKDVFADRSSFWAMLAQKGCVTNGYKAQAAFRQYVIDFTKTADLDETESLFVEGVSKSGWRKIAHEDGSDEWQYITDGFSTAPLVRYTGMKGTTWQTSGDELAYYAFMADLCRDNPMVGFLTGFTMAGFLLQHLTDQDHNPMFALLGDSSLGKTLAVYMTLSMRGHPEKLLNTFDATSNSLKQLCKQQNHCGVGVDEFGMLPHVTDKEVHALLYTLSLGKERGRLKKDPLGNYSSSQGDRAYNTILLTGEKAMLTTTAPIGTAVRLTTFAFDKDSHPLWDNVDDVKAKTHRAFVFANHGWIAPQAIRLIARDPQRYVDAMARFNAILAGDIEDGPQKRKANAFATSMAGVQVLADVFEATGHSAIFGQDAIDVILARAKQELTATIESNPIKDENEKFSSFLNSVMANNIAQLHYYDLEGEYHAPKDLSSENRIGVLRERFAGSVELSIFETHASQLASKAGIDLKLLLQWAEKEGIYKKHAVPRGDKVVYRTTKQITVMKRRAEAYIFTITQPTPEDIMAEAQADHEVLKADYARQIEKQSDAMVKGWLPEPPGVGIAPVAKKTAQAK